MLITPEYKQLQTAFHEERPDYGTSGSRHCQWVESVAEKMGTRSVLDYGCGKATLQKGLPFPIQNYDPCMPEYATRPTQADIVLCTDVMEHIERDLVDEVLADVFSFTKQVVFFNISTRLAKKVLPDGRNAHITLENSNWWLRKLLQYGEITSYQIGQGEFTCLMTPFPPIPEELPLFP